MSLIEELGGYDAAKDELGRLKNIYKESSIKNALIPTIEDLLLEYRRSNNIFEVDDYIIHDGELKVFAMWSTAIEGCAYIGYAYAEDGEMADKSEFRHATDAEIQAGHKL